MDLIERYLAAVGALLPGDLRADITAELRDVLLNRREEKEAETGRPLTKDEDAALLRDFGHPLLVAGRYGRQQYLVGPELYAIYILVVKVVLAIVAGSAIIAGVVKSAAGGDVGSAITASIAVAWNGLFVTVGVITIIFAALQRSDVRSHLLDNWNPRDLPRPTRRRRMGWLDHVAAIVVQVVFILWWTRVIQLWAPFIPLKTGEVLRVDLAAVWQSLYWPVIALSLGVIAVRVLRLVRGAKDRVTYGLDIVLQLGVVFAAAVALRAGHWVDVSASGLAADKLSSVDRGINIGLEVGLIVVVVAAAGTIAYDAWRLYRGREG